MWQTYRISKVATNERREDKMQPLFCWTIVTTYAWSSTPGNGYQVIKWAEKFDPPEKSEWGCSVNTKYISRDFVILFFFFVSRWVGRNARNPTVPWIMEKLLRTVNHPFSPTSTTECIDSLVFFFVISTIVGYLRPDVIHIY